MTRRAYYLSRLDYHRAQLRECTDDFAATRDPVAKAMLAGAMEHEAEQIALYASILRAKSRDYPLAAFEVAL